MINLIHSLKVWGSPQFNDTLKSELEDIDPTLLPLQQGISSGSYVSDTDFQAMIISSSDEPETIIVKVGIFYKSIIAGCNCADDPSPIEECNEYCEMQLAIRKQTAETNISLLSD